MQSVGEEEWGEEGGRREMGVAMGVEGGVLGALLMLCSYVVPPSSPTIHRSSFPALSIRPALLPLLPLLDLPLTSPSVSDPRRNGWYHSSLRPRSLSPHHRFRHPRPTLQSLRRCDSPRCWTQLWIDWIGRWACYWNYGRCCEFNIRARRAEGLMRGLSAFERTCSKVASSFLWSSSSCVSVPFHSIRYVY